MNVLDLPILTCLFEGGDAVQSRWSVGMLGVLLILLADGLQVATAWETGHPLALAARQDLSLAAMMGQPSRLMALTARQDLRDEVCVAMADGRITRSERYQILADARRILKGEEYEAFKRSLDRAMTPKSAAAKMLPIVSQGKSPPAERPKVLPVPPVPVAPVPRLADSTPALVIPTEATSPDRVELVGGAR
jgi:hypothetical protein